MWGRVYITVKLLHILVYVEIQIYVCIQYICFYMSINYCVAPAAGETQTMPKTKTDIGDAACRTRGKVVHTK